MIIAICFLISTLSVGVFLYKILVRISDYLVAFNRSIFCTRKWCSLDRNRARWGYYFDYGACKDITAIMIKHGSILDSGYTSIGVGNYEVYATEFDIRRAINEYVLKSSFQER